MVSWMLSFSWLYPIHGLLSITIRIGNILHSSFIYGTIRKDCLKGQSVQFSSFRLLSHVRLFATPWIAARQPSLSITSSQSSLKLMSIESVMPSCHPATSWEELTHWKRLSCWEGLGAGGEGADRGWDGWMASLTWWTWWVWVNSGSWWWTGRAGVLQFMGSQRVRHDWATELNWTELSY